MNQKNSSSDILPSQKISKFEIFNENSHEVDINKTFVPVISTIENIDASTFNNPDAFDNYRLRLTNYFYTRDEIDERIKNTEDEIKNKIDKINSLIGIEEGDTTSSIAKQLKDLSQKINKLETDVDSTKIDILGLKDRVSGAETNISGLGNGVGYLNTELSDLVGRVSDAETNISGLSTSVSNKVSFKGFYVDYMYLNATNFTFTAKHDGFIAGRAIHDNCSVDILYDGKWSGILNSSGASSKESANLFTIPIRQYSHYRLNGIRGIWIYYFPYA